MIIKTYLYGEKSHSYGVTVKTRDAPALGASLLSTPMIVIIIIISNDPTIIQ